MREEIMKNNFKKEFIMTKENENAFQTANKWHICIKIFTEKYVRVRDHCYVTGKCRGSIQSCNVNFRLANKIPVIFHNIYVDDMNVIS